MNKQNDNLISSRQAMGLFKTIIGAASLPAKLFLTIGIVLSLFGVKRVYDAHQSVSWLPVSGVITVSNMRVDTSTSTTGVGSRSERTTSTSYAPEISYDYSLAGVMYSNSDIILGGNVGTGSSSRARRLINKYPLGAQVTVYYNPKDPYQSVLERGVHLETWFVLGLGLGLIGFSMLWRAAFGSVVGLFQIRSKPIDKQPKAFSEAAATSPQEPRLIGKWKILKQLPPQSELTQFIMKAWGMPDDSTAIYPDTTETIVVITANTISFVTKSLGAFGDQSIPYIVKDDTLILSQLETNFLTQKMEPFFPAFYYYHFAGEQLVLKSNPIKGYQNRSITYFLSKLY